MKPLTLKFNGINCFNTLQEIDFSLLGGIFGIFGPTGSGKTTILDAMSIALFGETPRLGGKNFAFINNSTKEAMVELCFESEKTYKVIRTYKQKANGVESSALLMQNEKTIAEGARDVNSKIIEILKMTSADYSKCIALPQGEFSAFLKSSAAERTALIGKLFGLEEYGEGLVKAANNKKALLEQKCLLTKKQIDSYGESIAEQIKKLETETNKKQQELKSITQELSELLQKEQLQKEQKIQFAKYNEIAKKLDDLAKNEPIIAQNRTIFANHQIASTAKTQLLVLKKLATEVSELTQKLAETQKEYELANFDLATINRKIEEINKRAKTVAESDQIIVNLKQLAEKEKEINEQKNQLNAINAEIEEKKESLSRFNEDIKSENEFISIDLARLNDLVSKQNNTKQQIEQIEQSGGSVGNEIRKEVLQKVLSHLMQIFEDFQTQNRNLQKDIAQKAQTINELNGKIDTITFELGLRNSILEELTSAKQQLFKMQSAQNQLGFVSEQKALINIAYNNIEEQTNQANAEIEKLTAEIANLTKIKEQSEAKIKAISIEKDKNLLDEAESKVASEVEIGQPCPICGNNVSHIFAQRSANANYFNNSLSLAQKEHEQLLSRLRATEVQKSTQELRLQDLSQRFDEIKQREKSLQNLQNKILINFINITDNSLIEFGELLKATEENTKTLEDANKKIEAYQNEIKNLEQQNNKKSLSFAKNKEIIEIIFENCEKIRKIIAENDFLILENSKNNNLKILKDSLKSENELLSKQILALSKEIETHRANIAVLNEKIISTSEKISDCEKTKATIFAQISAFDASFKQLCHGYASVQDKIEKVLAAKESIESESKYAAESFKTATVKLMDCQRNLSIAQNLVDAKNSQISSQKTILQPVFNYFNSTDIELILSNILGDPSAVENEIEEFNKNKNLFEHELLNCPKPEKIDETNYNESISSLKEKISSTTLFIGSLIEQIESKKSDLEKQIKLADELEKDKQSLSILTEVCSLLRGKELLAFATEAFLQDITEKASSKLFSLLSGRYTLCYENKEFYVCDNFDNGAKRSCSTLSGGETFVVSLSLALSISETIVSHAARPNEFFFLDEGFGTLDAELRDVIVETLMKLKESGITIGLISHVEELKAEIKNRLVISKSTDKVGNIVSKISFEQDI